ncbi:MAG TPA: bifunctional DNA-formamidopyrimidine glycosylase/DNA-(apurinic or apyrimidinic site) lyase [Terriglobales bacterium]|nr:bifunctional DNA-formamidopyrimidine glycosylase/DNA-(apurinic or apyrimidinic site) lyase [Terriglobales bacterium]
MPELPEVETVRRTLLPLIDDRIIAVEVREARLRRVIATDFKARLSGRTVEAIERRAKYLLFRLSDGEWLLAHLGMTGSLVVQDGSAAPAAHDHVVLSFASGKRLVFNDPRRFGLLRVAAAETDLPELARIGRDPLTDPLSVEELKQLCRRRSRPIKNVLMDQALLGGIGNIYASEILFRAAIRPRRRAASLTRRELERLREAMTGVLADAVLLGGSSISDYRDGTGKPGYFQIHHQVYDRAGEPCRVCGTVIRRVVLLGRSTFYCPVCQR